jgi:membrane associated rhomboid family serine protease
MLTYAWLHDVPSPLHILFNMLGLYWFGTIVFDLIGQHKFVLIYFYGLLMGAVFYLLTPLIFPLIVYPSSTLVGSSAAVFALMTAAATLSPSYEFSFFIIGRIKIVYIVLAAVFISFIGIGMSNVGGNIAHMGGAFMGFVYIKLLRRGYDLGSIFSLIKKNPLQQKHLKVLYKNPSKLPTPQAKSAEIDRILDKINKSGYESLTKDEKQKLFNASKE